MHQNIRMLKSETVAQLDPDGQAVTALLWRADKSKRLTGEGDNIYDALSVNRKQSI